MSKKQFHFIQIHNPLEPTVNTHEVRDFRPGQSLADLFPTIAVSCRMAYTINGGLVEEEDMATTYVQAGDYVTQCPVPEGGGGGKQLLKIVAIIAMTVVTAGMGAAVGAAVMGIEGGAIMFAAAYGSLGVAIANTAVTIAGSMLVNALMPPPKPAKVDISAQEASPTYGIDGAKNTSNEGGVVPVAYGQHRMAGNIISNYVINDGDTQYLYMLLNAGEGEIAGISEASVLINDQPISSYAQSKSKPEFDFRPGTADQEPPKWFADTLIPISVGKKFTPDWQYADTGSAVDGIRLDASAPQGLFLLNDEGKTTNTQVVLRAEYRPWRLGANNLPWTPFVSSHDVVEYTEENVYNDIVQLDGYGNEISRTPGVGLPSDIVVDGVIYKGRESGGVQDNADIGTVVKGYVRKIPVYATGGQLLISGSTRSAVRRSYLSGPLPEDRYEVRFARQGAEGSGDDNKRFDTIYLTDVVGMVNEKVRYRHTATVGLKIRLSDHLSGIPNVTFINGGKIVDVWDGQKWVREASASPAWITLDILTNSRYGGGAARSRLDLERWKEWAAWCKTKGLEFHGVFDTSTNVWDAANQVARCGHAQISMVGTRYSVLIEREDKPVQLFNVANMIAGTFKEVWLPMQERANEIELTFTNKADNYLPATIRVVDAAAQASGAPSRKSTIQIMGIVDAQRAYEEATFALNLNRYILRTVQFSASMDAISCVVGDVVMVQHDMPRWGAGGLLEAGSTSTVLNLDRPVLMEGGRNYQALVHLDTLQRAAGTVSSVLGNTLYLTNFDGTPSIKRIVVGGRDMAVLGVDEYGAQFGVRVDSVDGISAGTPYTLHDTNVLVTRTVLNTVPAGEQLETQTITLTSSLGATPHQYGKWTFGESTKVSKPFRVRSITGSHEYRRDLTCIEYNAAIYEPAGAVPDMNYSSLPALEIRPVTIDGTSEEQVLIGTVYEPQVTVAFHNDHPNYQTAEVFVSRNGGLFQSVGKDRSGLTLSAAKGEQLVFRVVAIDRSGKSASVANAPTITHVVQGRIVEPGAVQGLTATFNNVGLVVKWDRPLEPDWLRTELRAGGDTAGVSQEVFSDRLTTFTLPWRTVAGTYKIFARHVLPTVQDAIFVQLAVNVQPPTAVAPQVLVTGAGSVTLMWPDARRSQALAKHRIRTGSTGLAFDQLTDAAVISGSSQSHTLVYSAPGTYRIWVQAEDMGGLKGDAGYVDVVVAQVGEKGDKGDPGIPGMRVARPAVYAWAPNLASIPSLVGTSPYEWTTGSLTGIPDGWSAAPTATPSAGYSLYKAEVYISDSAMTASTDVDWSKASVSVIGLAGTAGSKGENGSSGAASRIAYAIVTGSTIGTTPTTLVTDGSASFPPVNTWGQGETWQGTIGPYSANQAVFKLDGVYDPITNKTTWAAPYLANFKVGSLSAITANMGSITAGSLDIGGRLQISSAGYLVARGVQILDESGNVVLSTRSSASAQLPSSWVSASPGWLNTNISINSAGQLSGAGGGQVTLPGLGQSVFRILAVGNSATTQPSGTLGLYKDGSHVSGVGRSYVVTVIERATRNVLSNNVYDVYGDPGAAAAMAAALNALSSNVVVVVRTHDEPQNSRLNGGLDAAMYRCGASKAVFGSANFRARAAYVLIGIPGCGEGNGSESYQGKVDYDSNAWVDVSFSIVNGSIVGVSQSYTPTSLQDYGYTGDLNATNGANWSTNLAGRPADSELLNSQQQWSQVNNRPADDAIRNNLIDLSFWRQDGALPWPTNSEYNRLVNTSPSGGADLNAPGPKGGNDCVWYCKEQAGDGQNGGGWDSPFFTLDPTKAYRFVIPIRRFSGVANSYWGTNNVCDLNTATVNGNPYFAAVGPGALQTDRWYLFVGYVYPAGSTGNTNDSAGVWDCKTGQKIVPGNNFTFAASSGSVRHRAYQYYATAGAEQLFGRPMINVVDGTEPSLREYFEPGALLNTSITVSNGQLQGIGTSGVQVDNSYAPIGQNLLPASDMTNGNIFQISYSPNGAVFESGTPRLAEAESAWSHSNYCLASGFTKNAYIRQLGVATGTADGVGNGAVACDLYPFGNNVNGRVACVAGDRIIGSIYVNAHRCNYAVMLAFYDANGTGIAYPTSSYGVNENQANRLDLYNRAHVSYTAPAGAASCTLVLRKFNTFAGQGDSYLFFAAPQLERVNANVTTPSPYQPGPPTNTRQLGYTGDLNADSNGKIGINSSGQLYGVGAGNGIIVSNNQLALTSDGKLSNAGNIQGQVTTVPVVDADRYSNPAPSAFPVGTIREFKHADYIGLNSAYGSWVALETIKQYPHAQGSGVPAFQYAYQGDKTWRRRSVDDAGSGWTAWTQDLDRNAYTGDLNATNGATIGSNLQGAFTQSSWDTVMTSALIRSAHIGQLTANNLSVGTLTDTIRGGVSSPGRVEVTTNRIDVYDNSNIRRVRLGML